MPDEPDSGQVYRVALFGVTGSGKSSIVNLLADKPVAQVSTGVEACTKRAQCFPVSIGGKTFRLWDTMGFNQAEARDINPLSPYEQAYDLLQDLQHGVDLILLCARKDGINASLRNLYWLLDSFFFGGRVQIVLVLTHFDAPDDEWWDRNMHVIAQKCNIPAQFLPHACISTIQNASLQPDSIHEQSKQTLRALLEEYAVTPTRLPPLTGADVVESLHKHCQLNVPDAQTLVDHFGSPKRPFHVILFGETGAGKSSVINLILGNSAARVSFAMDSCTMGFCSYEITTELRKILIWDTVGFNGTYKGKDATVIALKNAACLVRDLYRKGGIDLLVFCKKGGRLTASELRCFKLFQEALCEGKVPVAFIITHLEYYDRMEEWWETDGEQLLASLNLKTGAVAGHACITSARMKAANQSLCDKLLLSKQLVQTMLEDSISYGSAFDKDVEVWVMSFLKKVVEIVRIGRKEKVLAKKLMEYCELTREQADELVKLFHSRGAPAIDSRTTSMRSDTF